MMKRIFQILLLVLLFASCTSKKVVTKASPPPQPPSANDSLGRDGDGVPDVINADDPRFEKQKILITESNIEIMPRGSAPRIKHVGKRASTTTDKKRSEGRIAYSIPDSMVVGKTFEAFARISQSRDTVTIMENLTGEVRTSVIAVSEVMEVELIDPGPEGDKNFAITKNNDGRQIIEDGETYTEWRWDVTPTKSGNKTLKIVVSVIRGSERKQTVYVDQIVVKSNVKLETKNFFEKYWQWLTTTIVIPFVVWLFKRKTEKKQ